MAYIRKLSEVATEIFVVMEVNTVFPGQTKDFFDNSPTMQAYFAKVLAAELEIFGGLDFSPRNVSVLPVKMGDVNLLSKEDLSSALHSDAYLIFGSSFLKGWLVDELIANSAVNIHMGISPYYRGSSCNFWALYDDNPAFVGATVHTLSTGLDNGAVLFHSRPEFHGQNSFSFSMAAVQKVQDELVSRLVSGDLLNLGPRMLDGSKQLRYTRNRDFTDGVANEFLGRDYSTAQFEELLYSKPQPDLI